MGTPAFMEFVESIQSEGVTFERVPMGAGAAGRESIVIEVDTENKQKNLVELDIPLPRLSRRFHRDFKDLDTLDPAALGNARLKLKAFTPEETREIVFKLMLDADDVHHTVQLEGAGAADYRSVIAFFARQLLKELRLVGGYDVLYGKVKQFVRDHLFEPPVSLEDPVVLRNLSEPEVGKVLFDSFKKAINALTVQESGTTAIDGRILLRDTRPFRTDRRQFVISSKSVFNKTVGEANAGGFEVDFAAFLENASDVAAFAKNYFAVGFKLDYVKADGDLSNYTPDFIVRDTSGTVWIIETKGRAEIDVPQKMARLRQWCSDATAAGVTDDGVKYRMAFVDQKGFEQYRPTTMAAVAASFTEYQA